VLDLGAAQRLATLKAPFAELAGVQRAVTMPSTPGAAFRLLPVSMDIDATFGDSGADDVAVGWFAAPRRACS
jgi:hypothetical protein